MEGFHLDKATEGAIHASDDQQGEVIVDDHPSLRSGEPRRPQKCGTLEAVDLEQGEARGRVETPSRFVVSLASWEAIQQKLREVKDRRGEFGQCDCSVINHRRCSGNYCTQPRERAVMSTYVYDRRMRGGAPTKDHQREVG